MNSPVYFILISIALLGLIAKRWTLPARGVTQLSLFIIGEISVVCGKGMPCENCPLSFGICPVGTTQRLTFIRHFPFYITLVLIGIIGLVFGTLTCGWACPIGFLQDLFNTPRLKNFKIPDSFKVVRYIVLFLTILLVILELNFHFLSKMGLALFHKFTIMGGILLLIVAVFTKRPLCKVLCPLGIIYGKLNKISPIKVGLDRKKCRDCGKCNKVCITDVQPVTEVNGELCAKCYSCKKVCKIERT